MGSVFKLIVLALQQRHEFRPILVDAGDLAVFMQRLKLSLQKHSRESFRLR